MYRRNWQMGLNHALMWINERSFAGYGKRIHGRASCDWRLSGSRGRQCPAPASASRGSDGKRRPGLRCNERSIDAMPRPLAENLERRCFIADWSHPIRAHAKQPYAYVIINRNENGHIWESGFQGEMKAARGAPPRRILTALLSRLQRIGPTTLPTTDRHQRRFPRHLNSRRSLSGRTPFDGFWRACW
jgi:hypothetical protein